MRARMLGFNPPPVAVGVANLISKTAELLSVCRSGLGDKPRLPLCLLTSRDEFSQNSQALIGGARDTQHVRHRETSQNAEILWGLRRLYFLHPRLDISDRLRQPIPALGIGFERGPSGN
jgi:hypothetical protein